MTKNYVNNFNSIKVQLERKPRQHYGIKSVFQFHKGTIRTRRVNRSVAVDGNFNSIKVQLEQ